MFLALFPILQGLFAGASVESVLAALSVSDWVNIATALISSVPEETKLLIQLHPVFEKIHGQAPSLAPTIAKNWMAENGDYVLRVYNDGIEKE